MATTLTFISTGMTVSWGGTDIPGLIDIRDDFDANELDGTIQASGNIRASVYGLPENTIELDLWFDPTDPGHLALMTDISTNPSPTKALVLASIPDGTGYTVNAIAFKIAPSEHVGDKRGATVTFKVQGLPSTDGKWGMTGTPS